MTDTEFYEGFAVYETDHKPQQIIFRDDLDYLRKFIHCDTLDMPTRFIEGRPFVFIVDDCGLINGRFPTAFGTSQSGRVYAPMLFGTFIVTKVNSSKEKFVDLNKTDLEVLKRNIWKTEESEHYMLMHLTYRRKQ